MKKLYTLREASDYLGLTESTLRGWINETHLSVVMMGRTMYIDSESLEDLKCPTEGVIRLKRAIDSLKSKQVSELRRVRQNAFTETVFRKFLSECSDKCVMYGMFQTLLRLLNNSGEITDMEFRVLSSLLAGDSVAVVATRLKITEEEIKDICLNALDKARKTRKSLNELKDEFPRLMEPSDEKYMEVVPGVDKEELKRLFDIVSGRKQRNHTEQETPENDEFVGFVNDKDANEPVTLPIQIEDSDSEPEHEKLGSLLHTLSTPISECPGLSVRTRNVLKLNKYENGYLINGETATIGELVSLTRNDVWRMRHCGRKTVEELDRLITGFGLKWKEETPDSNRIIRKRRKSE